MEAMSGVDGRRGAPGVSVHLIVTAHLCMMTQSLKKSKQESEESSKRFEKLSQESFPAKSERLGRHIPTRRDPFTTNTHGKRMTLNASCVDYTPLLLPMIKLEDLDVLADETSDHDEPKHCVSFALGCHSPRVRTRDTIPRQPIGLSQIEPSSDSVRRRRLDRERLRVHAAKYRVEELRRDMEALLITRDEMLRQLQRRHDQQRLHDYVHLVRSTEQLLQYRRGQEAMLERYEKTTTSLPLLNMINRTHHIAANNAVESSVAIETRDDKTGWILMDPISLFESVIHDEPLSTHEATAFVADSCREMAHSLAQPDWAFGVITCGDGTSGDGLRGGRRVTGELLEFRLVKRFPQVQAQTLVEKTWPLLTQRDLYQLIQPQCTQFRVLQRVSDACWVVGLVVGSRHSLILVGNTAVGDNYVVTFRSLPLARNDSSAKGFAKQTFLESETGGILANTFSWYSFRQQPSVTGEGVDCEVTFGGTARNVNPHYLNQLQLEVIAGFARWQTAVGFPHVLFVNPLETQ